MCVAAVVFEGRGVFYFGGLLVMVFFDYFCGRAEGGGGEVVECGISG